MKLSVTFLKEMIQNAAGSITLKLKAIKCPTGQRCQNALMRDCNIQTETQTLTIPSRSTIVRPENAECYTLINSSKLRVKRADYLGKAILKTQSKVVMEPYW
jgi:hypothetical protein